MENQIKTAKAKRVDLSVATQGEILEMIAKGDKKQSEIAVLFNVSNSTISKIKNRAANVKRVIQEGHIDSNKCKRARVDDKTVSQKLQKTLFNWLLNAEEQNEPLDGKILQEKALEIAERLKYYEFKASAGWIEWFKRKYNIKLKRSTWVGKKVIESISSGSFPLKEENIENSTESIFYILAKDREERMKMDTSNYILEVDPKQKALSIPNSVEEHMNMKM